MVLDPVFPVLPVVVYRQSKELPLEQAPLSACRIDHTQLFGGKLIDQAAMAESQEAMAAACLELGPKAALVKGGHCSGEECVDFLATDDGERIAFSRKRIPGGSKVRGTGCRLASAIACFQAKGLNLKDSVGEACEYLAGYISDRVDCG